MFLNFFKTVGEKIFGKKEEAKAVEEAGVDAVSSDVVNSFKANALFNLLHSMNLSISDIGITVEDDKVIVSGNAETQADKEKVTLTLGNVEGIASVENYIEVVEAADKARFYEVQKGDYLSKIALEMYGNASRYPEIFEANKPMLTHPDKIYPGQQLRIPA